MVSIPLASLVAACQWLRKIHENRDEPTVKAWLRHDADPLPLLKELEDARTANEAGEALPPVEDFSEWVEMAARKSPEPRCPACGNGMHRDAVQGIRVWRCNMFDCRYTIGRLKTSENEHPEVSP